MVIMTEWGLGCSRVLSLVLGRLTWTPVWMIGAVTMKITSRTSITSTRGVTLISDREVWVRPRWFVNAILLPTLRSPLYLFQIPNFRSQISDHLRSQIPDPDPTAA